MILEFQIFFGFFAFLFLTILISNIIKKKRTNKQRSKSSIRCHYCGEPMLESDVFCENCWKITPKVQEMLNNHPNRSPSSYVFISHGNNKRCPHCKKVYNELTRYPNLYLESPIQCCPHCHLYFIDFINYEWSVCKLSFKIGKLAACLLCFVALAELFCYTPEPFDWWQQILIIGEFTVVYLLLFLGWYFIFPRKKHILSFKRLKRNPDYPKILMDMGYGIMINKKYYHLSKVPIIPFKDKAKTILKEAFTFD